MQRMILYFLMAFAFAATSAHAGAGHDHGPPKKISQLQAAEQATSIVGKLVEAGKLEKSWGKVNPTQIQKQTNENRPEWVITFNNPQAKDQEKQNLYVFLSPSGRYLAANFTGK